MFGPKGSINSLRMLILAFLTWISNVKDLHLYHEGEKVGFEVWREAAQEFVEGVEHSKLFEGPKETGKGYAGDL